MQIWGIPTIEISKLENGIFNKIKNQRAKFPFYGDFPLSFTSSSTKDKKEKENNPEKKLPTSSQNHPKMKKKQRKIETIRIQREREERENLTEMVSSMAIRTQQTI